MCSCPTYLTPKLSKTRLNWTGRRCVSRDQECGGPRNICVGAVSLSNIYLQACLLEVSHKCFSWFTNRWNHFHFFSQIILLNDVFWEQRDGNLHIFLPIHGGTRVTVFNVNANILCSFLTQHTVTFFWCCKVGRDGGDTTWICNEITSIYDTYLVGVVLLWYIVDDNATVGDCPIPGDVLYFRWVHDKNWVCRFWPCFIISL